MKGIVLTLDSIIALLLMVTVVSLLVFFRTDSSSPFFMVQQLHSLSEDSLNILSVSKLTEVTSPSLINYYLSNGVLNEGDLNKNALEVIGALWSANKSEAANISKDILDDILPANIGYQILINGDNVYNSSDTNRTSYSTATAEISSSRIASGYEKNKTTSGYVARAWATKVKKNVTVTVPINLEWGGYSEGSNYWGNGYAPSTERSREAILKKNFTIPSDATIFSAILQLSMNSDHVRALINGVKVYEGSDSIYEKDVTKNITSGMNQIVIAFNNSGGDLAHLHPGNFIKIKYNTSQVDSGSNVTVFNADWIQGAPAANEIIPFFVNSNITNVTAFVDVQNLNAFLLLTLNYKYNSSNPLQNVILYKVYPNAIDCNQYTNQPSCQSYPDQCSWTLPVNNTLFHATFDGWSTSTNCSGSSTEGWNECKAVDNLAYWRARVGIGSYNSSSTQYLEGSNITTDNSTWVTKCLNLSSYSNAYVTFWYNKTATNSPTNYTLFHATFDGWSTSTNCSGSSTEGWNECKSSDSGAYWRGSTSGKPYLNSSSTQVLNGSSITTAGGTYITKCLDTSAYQKAYIKFDWSLKSGSSDEYISLSSNKTGSSSLTEFWRSGTSGTYTWSNKEIDITSNISSKTCFRVYCWRARHAGDYCSIDDFKIIGTSNFDEKQFMLVNKTGTGAFSTIWNSSTSASPWTYKELNITDNISGYTCIRYMIGTVSSVDKKLLLDDFKIVGTSKGLCSNNTFQEDVKNRTFVITFNQTGTLIQEYNLTILLNTTFNPNVTIKNINQNMTNTFGIYADIRAPNNSLVINGNGDVDWQRLGMYANDNTAGHGNDHYCFITDKTNVTVYHDPDQYGLQYGKIDINGIQNFTDQVVNCTSKNNLSTCKDAFINLTFPFATNLITSRVLGTQDLAGNDNGYNWVWAWSGGQANETNIILDTDTPPGTFTYLPVKFFQLNKMNTVRVGDKDLGRELDTNPTSLMGNKRSIVEYTFLIPSQVGYGDVFETENNATTDAKNRLFDILGRYATSADILTENHSVSNVPYMWGPASIRVSVWL